MNKPDANLSLPNLMRLLSDESNAYDLLEQVRWPDGEPVCPHCGEKGRSYVLKARAGTRTTRGGNTTYRKLWKCGACRRQFSVTVGTVMERSKVPVSKWLIAFQLFASAKNGISSHELARALEISQESAWFMLHRIRYATEELAVNPLLAGIVESDETYIGGKISGQGIGRGAYEQNKTAVVALVQRGGRVKSMTVPTVNSANLDAVLAGNVAEGAFLMTDSNQSYIKPGRKFRGHASVDHNRDEYVRGHGPAAVHVNTAEGHFSQLKRSIDGTHHKVSRQHLHRYLAEFDERRNTRDMKDSERAAKIIRQTAGRRLMYEKVVNPDS